MSRYEMSALDSKGLMCDIAMGYDLPLGGFFMTIYYQSDDPYVEDEDILVYSNLDQPVAFLQTIEPYRDVIRGLGIDLPESFFESVLKDQPRAE